jgi:cellulose synthase/poly-beta-1,6-N-acetylglucosamine synthase-like glycosyltransferase
MTSTEIVVARPTQLVPRDRAVSRPSAFERAVVAAASRAGGAKRSLEGSLHRMRNPAPKRRPARILAIIPAHNEGDRNWANPARAAAAGTTPIERTLIAIERQTRRPDRTVVIVNNSVDDTAARARRFRWATVIVLDNNADRKVGALNYAWQEWSAGYDFVAGIDADTEIAPECLEQLENEMVRRPQAAGIMARYAMRQDDAQGPVSKMLVRAQRLDFSSWVDESMAHNRDTYVLGGQATLFRRDALAKVRDDHHRAGPWDPSADVEDMELTWRVKEDNRTALTSAEARAYVGAMHTLRSLWAQRLKWARGMAALLRTTGFTRTTAYPWKQQAGLAVNALVRVALAFLLPASLIAHQFVWSWIWLAPVALSWILNIRSALRVPDRRPSDVLYAALLVPAEIYLWFQIAVTATAWFQVLSGNRSDAWAKQSSAESGGSQGWWKILLVLLGIAGAAFTVAHFWGTVDPDVQSRVLTVGWSALSVLTISQCLLMVRRIFRRYHGLRP